MLKTCPLSERPDGMPENYIKVEIETHADGELIHKAQGDANNILSGLINCSVSILKEIALATNQPDEFMGFVRNFSNAIMLEGMEKESEMKRSTVECQLVHH